MSNPDLDAFVVGCGFGGICELYHLRKRGLSARAIDRAGGVGGTWFWNRYPGAMSDTESYLYRFSFEKDLLCSYPWENHYVSQPETLAYLEHVVERYDLKKDIQLRTELQSAKWDEEESLWILQLRSLNDDPQTTQTLRVRYLVTALGLLSSPTFPDIPGISSFQGKIVHTAAWTDDIEVENKRVGVIGCGSTGIQVISNLASRVNSLVSFQRRAQYCVPNGNRRVEPGYRKWVNENYDQIWDGVWNSATGFGFEESTVPFASVTRTEQEQIFENLWQRGNGFRFMFGGFSDITTNKEANEAACNFIRKKIAQIVTDPEKARKLTPKDAYARRPLCDGGYYEACNRDNVSIVDVTETPIEAIVPEGIIMTDGTLHELDLIVFATGFDAIEGSYNQLDIEGRGKVNLRDAWKDRGPTGFMGVAVNGFPNLFMVFGPQGPFSNNPPCIEREVAFHQQLIEHAESLRKQGRGGVLDVSPEAESAWVQHCEDLAEGSLFKETASWIFGNNVQNKTVALRFYFGGLKNYQKAVDDVVAGGFMPFQGLSELN